jgi:2,5-furandicarboxylate decarboxylase 1
MDLRTYLKDLEERHPEALLRVERPLSCEYEITELQRRLDAARRQPVVFVRNPVRVDGTPSAFPLVTNLTASRTLCAEMLGLDPRHVGRDYGARLARRIPPVAVRPAEAPVKEVVRRGGDVDLGAFPFATHNLLDPGPYLGTGFCTTVDPDTGVDNTALQRIWVKAPRRCGYWPALSSHSARNMEKWWARGEGMPMAVWVGHHPAGMAGAQSRLGYPESHWPAMGGALGEPVRLVPSETWGDRLMVPADAELVIEGVVPKDVYEAEAPFGEYPGYIGPQRPSPVFEVTCVTHRRDAIFHDVGVGLVDHLVLMGNFPLEARLYEVVKQVVPELVNVHVPISGHRFHAYLQVRKTRPGVGKDAILAALPVDTRLKHVFVVDEDIDIFDDSQVMWAVASRSQWDRDAVVITGLSTFPLDPTLSAPGLWSAKGGIDATMPPPLEPGLPRQFQLVNQSPPQVRDRVRLEDLVTPEQLARFPSTF